MLKLEGGKTKMITLRDGEVRVKGPKLLKGFLFKAVFCHMHGYFS